MNKELSKLSLEEIDGLKEEIDRFFNDDLFKFPTSISNLTLSAKYYNLLINNVIEGNKLKLAFYGIDMIIFDLDKLEITISDNYENNLGLIEATLIGNYEGFSRKDEFLDYIEYEKNILKDKFIFENNIKAINEEIENIKSLFNIVFTFGENFDGYKLERNEKEEDNNTDNEEEIKKDNEEENQDFEIKSNKKQSIIKRIIKKVVKF